MAIDSHNLEWHLEWPPQLAGQEQLPLPDRTLRGMFDDRRVVVPGSWNEISPRAETNTIVPTEEARSLEDIQLELNMILPDIA